MSTVRRTIVFGVGNVQFDHRKMGDFEIWRFYTAENDFLGKKKGIENPMISNKMLIIEENLRNIAQ